MLLTRRRFAGLTTAALCAAPFAARGQVEIFPHGMVRLIVPFPPGGATDALARALTVPLQALWAQTVIQENRPGAAGSIGAKQVAAAEADGHTLLMASTGTILSLAGAQGGGGAFDITKELAPVSMVSAPPYIAVANPSIQVGSTAELIAYAKKHPGKLSYGSSGVGSASHLSGALFAQMAGIDMLHVPYRGTGPATTDLLGDRIQVMFAPALTAVPHIRANTLRVIGVTGAQRSALFPEFPTIAETGLPGYASLGWFGLFAPPATRPAILAKISEDVGSVLRSDDAKKRLAEQGAEPAPNTPDEFERYVNEDVAKWLDLAAKAKIKLGTG